MSSGAPDLFVICKSCGSEVSPYITECPYCGNRLRKRAPRLDRDGQPAEKPRRRRRRKTVTPTLGPLRPGEIPGIRVDGRPYATIALVSASLVLLVLLEAGAVGLRDVMLFGAPDGDWWKVATAPFAYDSSGYAFAALFALAVFGWLLERRHGPLAVLLLFCAGGMGGIAVVALAETFPVALGANGAALAFVVAWAIPDLLDLRRGREIDGDLLGAAVIAVVLLLLPLAVETADALAGLVGVAVGLVLGYPLAKLHARRG
jgi:membrane associated rhomboid family serine protease